MYWSRSKIRSSSSRSVQSSLRESTMAWKSSASTDRKLPEERAVQQEQVQRDDEPGHEGGEDRRRAPVDQPVHDVAPAGEQDERHERERNPEAQHDLRDHQRARRVEPDGEHD